MKFSPDFIERVREANNIVDIINQYTQLKGSGNGRHMGLCPFPDHSEKSPSFSVSETQQLYHCFGCKKSGNIYHFVQALQGLNFPETVELLAEKAGIDLPKEALNSKADDEWTKKRKLAWKISEYASDFFHQSLLKLPTDHPAKAYCRKRKLTPELIKEFKIGYAPDSWDTFLNLLKKQNLSVNMATELGLIRNRTKGDGSYDGFRDRLMFPIVSYKNNTIGFGGRILKDENPKYINSPESLIFHKGKTLYGLNLSGRFIRSNDHVLIVEGYMDFLALYSVGIKNIGATLGTALTPEHAQVIKKYTKNVTLLFDGDSAGQKAAERSLPILLEAGLMPKICVLKDKMDPDDFIQANGLDAMKEALKASPDLFIHLLDTHLKDYRGQASEKVNLIEKVAPLLKLTSETMLRDLYIAEICDRLQVERQWVINSVRSVLSGQKQKTFSAPESKELTSNAPSDVPTEVEEPMLENFDLSKTPNAELYLINLCLMKTQLLDKCLESEIHKQFSDQNAAKVLQRIERIYRQTPNKFDSLGALLLSMVEPRKAISLRLEPQLADLDNDGLEQMRKDCEKQIREKHMRSEAKSLSLGLKGGTPEEQLKKLEQFMNIQKSRRNLKKDVDPS